MRHTARVRRPRLGTPVRRALRRSVAALGLVALGGVLLVLPASAQGGSAAPGPGDCTAEVEPNDVPEGAPELTGLVCQDGELPEDDPQDLAIWTVSEADATQLWTFAVDGVVGAVTSLRLLPIVSEPGVEPLEIGVQLLQVDGTPDEPSGSSVPVLLRPGRYLLGISRSAFSPRAVPSDLGYRSAVRPAGALPASGDAEPNDDPTQASPTGGAEFQLTGDGTGGSDIYAWTVPDAGGDWWALTAQAPLGDILSLTLSDADGVAMAIQTSDPDGRASLPDLDLAPGTYLVTVDASSVPTAPYMLTAATQPPGDGDPEPNDDPTHARTVEVGSTSNGRIARPGDLDGYHFVIDQAESSVLVDVRLMWFGGERRELCLLPWDDGVDATPLKCVEGTEGVSISGLSLGPGDYALTVKGDPRPDDPYYLRIEGTSAAVAGFETEPNDTATTATPVSTDRVSHGRSEAGDPDHYLVHVTGEPQLWQVDVAGEGLDELSLVRIDDEPLAAASIDPAGAHATLTDLYLTPGDHWLRVKGHGGDYDLSFTALGPPDPDSEREPNDDSTDAEVLEVGEPRSGRIATDGDIDVYRFSTVATERLVLHIEPPAQGSVAFSLVRSGRPLVTAAEPAPGVAIADDLLLPPGDYEVWLDAGSVGSERYRVWLERQDPLTVAIDQEPDDSFADARPLPPDGVIEGTADASGGSDWFQLPPSVDGLPLEVAVEGDVAELWVNDDITDYPLLQDEDGAYRSGGLPIEVPMALVVRATGPYRLTVGAATPAPRVERPTLPVDLAVALQPEPPAAYWPAGQRLAGTLTLTASGTQALDLTLDAVTSDPLVRLDLDQPTVRLEPGATLEVPLTLRLQPDLPRDHPIRLTVRAMGADGSQRTASAEVTAGGDVPPVSPEQAWALPASMLGGLDVAALSLGATTLPVLDPVGEDALHDGVALSGAGLQAPFGALPIDLAVDLAGDEPVPVVGIVLDPLAGGSSFEGLVRDFELLLSTDGVTFEPALSGTLSPLGREQAFALPDPVPATYAQLRIRSLYGDGPDSVVLGEWKVVAQPGFVPAGVALDLAPPERGGHVVWMQPQQSAYEVADAILSVDPTRMAVKATGDDDLAWVIAFRADRAARVARLGWVNPPDADPQGVVRRVRVSASLASPLGPWEPLGTWRVVPGDDGTVAPFVLDSPTWVRYLRFVADVPSTPTDDVDLPTTISIIEEPLAADPRSALGEWGAAQEAGPLEWSQPPDLSYPVDTTEVPDTPDQAAPLEVGVPAIGRVHRGEDVDWYAFRVPDGQRSVTLTVGGTPSVGVALDLVDADGNPVDSSFGPGRVPGTVEYHANVDAGATYRVQVRQPPLSAIVAYDTSISLSAYQPLVTQSIRAYAAGVVPGQEVMNFLPFDQKPLLEDWTDDPWVLRSAVDGFLGDVSSSSAETALIDASRLLSTREGARAILLVTDAETGSADRSTEMWQSLDTVRPVVFTVHIGGGSQPLVSPRLMQDWSNASAGVYAYARSHADIDRAFDRMSTWMRRSTGYQVTLETSADRLPAPDPGTLRVRTPPDAAGEPTKAPLAPDVAIEVILDTSGSMRDQTNGERRIDAAKAVLTDLVQDKLPRGAPVALRILGSKDDPCGTRLAIPLSPLDPDRVSELVGRIRVDQAADTPLGDAIAAVATDLEGSTGTKILLLITDSEEVWPHKDLCGRDPAEAIKGLRAAGIDVRVNVVGLSVDSRQAQRQMRRWAEIGNGAFFRADDTGSLGRAVDTALSAPFVVHDTQGDEVASGTVNGDTVELPPGTYEVVVLTEPRLVIPGVVVTSNQTAEVTAAQPASEGEEAP